MIEITVAMMMVIIMGLLVFLSRTREALKIAEAERRLAIAAKDEAESALVEIVDEHGEIDLSRRSQRAKVGMDLACGEPAHSGVAQLVERRALNPVVAGSIPAARSTTMTVSPYDTATSPFMIALTAMMMLRMTEKRREIDGGGQKIQDRIKQIRAQIEETRDE